MQAPTIEMPPEDARRKLRAYRRRKHKDAEDEYAAAVKLLEAAADGFPIINVADAIAEAPGDDRGRPMLAIARADRFNHDASSRICFDSAVARETDTLTLYFTSPKFRRTISRGFATVPMVLIGRAHV